MAKTTKTSTAAKKTTATAAVKTAATKATPVKAEPKVEVKPAPVVAPVVEEKKPATKKACAKTAAVKEETKAEVKAEVFVEFAGVQSSIDKVIEDVKKTYAAQGNTEEIKSVKVYLKPEDHAAYYVINETIEGRMDVFFC